MKTVLQACIGSIIIHVFYFVSLIAIGYVQTKFYKPDLVEAFDNVDILQDEVVFGLAVSPAFGVMSFLIIAIICGIIISSYKKLKSIR